MNCGDWVESCTALVEHEDGRFEIIPWVETDLSLPAPPDEEADIAERKTGIAA